MEKKLLDLTLEYANHEDEAASLRALGLEPDRTRDEIAAEYGQVLKAFIAA
jgi:hypothetical protein